MFMFIFMSSQLMARWWHSRPCPVPDVYGPWASKPRSSTPGNANLGVEPRPGYGVLVEKWSDFWAEFWLGLRWFSNCSGVKQPNSCGFCTDSWIGNSGSIIGFKIWHPRFRQRGLKGNNMNSSTCQKWGVRITRQNQMGTLRPNRDLWCFFRPTRNGHVIG